MRQLIPPRVPLRSPFPACALAMGLAGCVPPFGPPAGTPDPLVLVPPSILSFELGCGEERDRWSLAVEADAWSGGGRLYWTPDGDYVENHPVRSAEAAPDGTSDLLKLELKVVGDWREVSPGGSTAVRCAQDPSLLFLLYDVEGEVSDCLLGGPDPDGLTALPGIPDCAE